MSLSHLRWSTRVELTCGCFQRFEQVGYATPIPTPGEGWSCQSHGDVEIRQSWRVGR